MNFLKPVWWRVAGLALTLGLLALPASAKNREQPKPPAPKLGPWVAAEKTYKVTEEAQAPDLTLESATTVSPSFPLSKLYKEGRITWLLMCNQSCEGLRETLRHMAEWVHLYGEFGAHAYAFLHKTIGPWPEMETLRKDFGKEITFFTNQEIRNLEDLMASYEVDLSPTMFVSTPRGFLMGRLTGYSPKDLTEWNGYFSDMFRPLIRQKLQSQQPGGGKKEEDANGW